MTRFKYVWENISDPAVYDTITGNCYFINDEDDIERIVGLLNNLYQENQQLNMSSRYDHNEIEEWGICMNEKRFEDDGVEYINNYNYALLDTYYEFDDERIIEWNKHSGNAQYTDLERITEILNIKQMRLESLMKHREEIGKLLDRIEEQQSLIEELYDFRLTYNALLFNEWAENQKYEVYKSRRHSDGELCFDGEYFIVVANLPTGQVTNHYHIRHWDMFKINEYEKVKEGFDGHTPSDVIERLQNVINDE